MFPGKGVAICTALAPTYAYGHGKRRKTASEWGAWAAWQVQQKHKSRADARRRIKELVKELAKNGDEESRKKVDRMRAVTSKYQTRAKVSGRAKAAKKREVSGNDQ
jgi:hypothetical protein